MLNNKLTWLCFGLLVLLQLWAPASMIFERESVLRTGKVFRFRTAPVDPNDPLRGKYILLRFQESSFYTKGQATWAAGDKLYVQIKNDEKGFAKIQAVSSQRPSTDLDFIVAKVDYMSYDNNKMVFIEWPFERFYMEESKALPAEKVYQQSTLDSTQTTYAIVKVKSGDAVLQDVFINDKPITSYIKQ